ncbi:MAG: phosphatidylglycerol:prolipoprotein diacylglycerol transferase, partial [Pirellulaceae bacterium]
YLTTGCSNLDGFPSLPTPPLYIFLMLSSIVIMSVLLRRTQAKLPITWQQKVGLGIGGFCGAMIGAKLPFVAYYWQAASDGSIWLAHGKTIMCGIVGGYFGIEFAKWVCDVRVKTGDTYAAPVALAVSIGRLGCYCAGCCYGKATQATWGAFFPTAPDGGTVLRHPTQIYESLFHFLAAILLAYCTYRGFFKNQLVKIYILAYLVYRYLSESIRPEPAVFFGLTAYQWAAIVLVPVFAYLYWRDEQSAQGQSAQGQSANGQSAQGQSAQGQSANGISED